MFKYGEIDNITLTHQIIFKVVSESIRKNKILKFDLSKTKFLAYMILVVRWKLNFLRFTKIRIKREIVIEIYKKYIEGK